MTRAFLAPLEILYAAALRARNARENARAPRQLPRPVISVGNLSVGGSGKTPVVICLAQSLVRRGYSVDVLSRGYGRRGSAVERVDPRGSAERFGDEPLMIAQTAQVPVFVGADRYAAGLLAEREGIAAAPHVHLLDDGFQHRRLGRAVDIVAIHRDDLANRLLPAGRLREPLASLERADVIVLREQDAELEADLRRYTAGGCRFWLVRRRLTLPTAGSRAVAFCAIARPGEFFADLTRAGLALVERVSFRDHHRYGRTEIERLVKSAKRHGGDGFVTTEKDAVKLGGEARARLEEIAPLRVVRLTAELQNEEPAMEDLRTMLEMHET